jgi:hypothetical protein
MKKEHAIALFHEKTVRRHWDDKHDLWYFSIVDVIEILTESTIPKRYWSDLKKKLRAEGSEVYEKIVQLKSLKRNLPKVWSRIKKLRNKEALSLVSQEKKSKSEQVKVSFL